MNLIIYYYSKQKNKQILFANTIDGLKGIILITPQLNMMQLETTFNPVHLIAVTFFFRRLRMHYFNDNYMLFGRYDWYYCSLGSGIGF